MRRRESRLINFGRVFRQRIGFVVIPRTMRRIRIFFASPGDVAEERDAASLVIEEIRRIVGSYLHIDVEAVRWETHAFPDVGQDAQDVINREIGEFDIFVGIMWKRFGTPTKRADSGTAEEFERAFELFAKSGHPKIMFYFRTTPFYSTDTTELRQFQKVLAFRSKLQKLGVLFWEYDQTLDFERALREHLLRRFLDEKASKPSTKLQTKEKVTTAEAILAIRKQFPVFFAYSHSDAAKVRQFATSMRIGGYPVWIDSDELIPGQNWKESVQLAIKESSAVLLFVSQDTAQKNSSLFFELSMILHAVKASAGKNPLIVVVRLDQTLVPTSFENCMTFDGTAKDGVLSLFDYLDSRAHYYKKG